MWQYVFLLLRRQPGKSALASIGFLLAACALVLLSATTQTTVVQANQTISQNWRPTYDLVVLPPQVKIPANQALEESHFKPGGFACPEIALEGANSYEVQASERHIAVVPFTDVVR